jgi:lysophospholipase L1-like esterase
VNSNWPNSFSPQSIANLALWMDGRAATFSDAGGTTAATDPAGRVRRIDQPAPLTGSWLASADAVRAFREPGSLYFQPNGTASGNNISQPVGPTVTGNNATLAVSFVLRDLPAPFNAAIIYGAGGGTWGFDLAGATTTALRVRNQGVTWTTNIAVPELVACSIVMRATSSGMDLSDNFGGITGTASLTQALGSAAIGSFVAGLGSGGTFQGSISQIAIYNRAISDAERAALLAFMVANSPPTAFPTGAPLVQISGDSIAAGFNVDKHLQSWPFKMVNNLYATAPSVRLFDSAIAGWTIAQMATDYPTWVKPNYSTSRTRNILIAAGATNSMAFGTLTAAQVLAAYYAYCDQARADGFLVVSCSVLPRTDAGIRGTFEADRGTFNSDLAANHAAHSDAYADVASIVGMSTPTDTTGTNFTADHVHPSAAGHALIEAVVRTAVLSLL